MPPKQHKKRWHKEDDRTEGKILPLQESSVCRPPLCRKTHLSLAISDHLISRMKHKWLEISFQQVLASF
jgi:hypothetical protein